MIKRHRFLLLDVFTELPYSGNPLAVVLCPGEFPEDTMQRIAAEFNFSETTFVSTRPGDEGDYRVRIFTPAREIAFAGHPILGTAWVIRHHIAAVAQEPVVLNLAQWQVPVTFDYTDDGSETAWFRAPPMTLGATADRDLVAAALGLSTQDIDVKSPVQKISAGTSAVIVPLRSSAALQRCKLDLDRYAPLAAQGFPPLVYLFCEHTRHPDNDLSARFFFDAQGVREDPATGNGAAFLGAYLLRQQPARGTELSLRIEQGYGLQRPSLVMLRARMTGDAHEIFVGGHVVQTARGDLV